MRFCLLQVPAGQGTCLILLTLERVGVSSLAALLLGQAMHCCHLIAFWVGGLCTCVSFRPFEAGTPASSTTALLLLKLQPGTFPGLHSHPLITPQGCPVMRGSGYRYVFTF